MKNKRFWTDEVQRQQLLRRRRDEAEEAEGGAPEWVIPDALIDLDLVNAQYYAGELEVAAFADVLEANEDVQGNTGVPALTPGVGLRATTAGHTFYGVGVALTAELVALVPAAHAVLLEITADACGAGQSVNFFAGLGLYPDFGPVKGLSAGANGGASWTADGTVYGGVTDDFNFLATSTIDDLVVLPSAVAISVAADGSTIQCVTDTTTGTTGADSALQDADGPTFGIYVNANKGLGATITATIKRIVILPPKTGAELAAIIAAL